MNISHRIAVAAMLAAVHLGATAAAPRFTCRPLLDEGATADDSNPYAGTINNKNQVIGRGLGTWQGTSSAGSMQWGRDRIGHRIVGESTVADINDKGWLVGYRRDENAKPHPILWKDGQAIELGAVKGANGIAYASAINKHGDAVGHSFVAPDGTMDQYRATLWSNGKVHRLPGLQKKDSTVAVDINDAGVVLGYSSYPWADTPVVWKNGVAAELVLPPGGIDGYVRSINNAGLSVGMTIYGGNIGGLGTVWRDLQPVNIGGLSNYYTTDALDINEAGAIVGIAERTFPEPPVAVYWASPEDAPVRLDTLVDGGCVDSFGVPHDLASADSINDQGVIVANSVGTNWNAAAAFRLTPR